MSCHSGLGRIASRCAARLGVCSLRRAYSHGVSGLPTVPSLYGQACQWFPIAQYATRRLTVGAFLKDQDDGTLIVEVSDTSDRIYEQPKLYDAAFSYRNFKDEVDFIQEVNRTFGGGTPLTSVIEIGCGPAHHAIRLAQAGSKRVLAVDTNRQMLEYAATRAAAMGVKVAFSCQDMRTFVRPDGFPPADMCLCLLGTFAHMLDNEQALSCLRSVRAALRPGGLFVLELTHPGDLFDGTFIVGDGGKEVWEVPIDPVTLEPSGNEDGGAKLMVEWGAEFDALDPVSQVLVRTVSMSVLDGPEVRQSVEASVPQRMFTVQELSLMAQATDLEVVEMYGEMRMDVSLSHEDAYRLVIILRRAEPGLTVRKEP